MILVTGGAGYIGSHVCLELLAAGYAVGVIDNLWNASAEALRRVERLAGKPVVFEKADVRDRGAVEDFMATHRVEAVIHLAGLKNVGESSSDPLAYYDANVSGAAHLFAAMAARGIKTVVFSSSATVYGAPETLPLPETHRCDPANPYGRTKLIVEGMLADLARADPSWRVGVLRYFNPVGAHQSGQIGEDPTGVPNNLMPSMAQVAAGRLPHLTIHGDTYATPDGTGVRDYVHVVDVAHAHVRALQHLSRENFVLNLGTGRGYSVYEIIRAFEAACGRMIPYAVGPARAGDVAACYADTSEAERVLGWHATRDLGAMCADHWRWQSANPNGYRSS